MSGTFPTSPAFRAVTLKSERTNFRSESVSGRTTVRNIGGQKWRFTAKFAPLTRAQFGPIAAFVMQQKGGSESFTVQIPEYSDQSGDATGTILANGGAAIGATSAAIDGITGTLKAGDFIKWANHNKVYMITADLTGAGTLSFQPELASSVADNEALTYTAVPFTVRLDNDVQEYGISTDLLVGYEIDMVEVI